jgi:succinate dehydrogenase / fumarate reductase, cytochrome b subunit
MSQQGNQPSPKNLWKWFNPLGRETGGWAFILSRITALGLTLYLFLHLAVLFQLSKGPQAYDSFLELIHSPVFIFGELLVVAAGIIHGLNGIRIVLTSFGIGVTTQKQLFYGLMAVSVVTILMFAFRMFGG